MEIGGCPDDDRGAPAHTPGAGLTHDEERRQHVVHHARSQLPPLRPRHVSRERRVSSATANVPVARQLLHHRLVQRVAA